VDDELELASVIAEDAVDRLAVTDVEIACAEARAVGLPKTVGLRPRRRRLAEEVRTHIVVDADHVEPLLDEVGRRLRADQAPRSRDDRYSHAALGPLVPTRTRARSG